MSNKHPNNNIAFAGVAGANADLICRRAYPYMTSLPVATFEDVFEAVEHGTAAIGMIPIENSHAGRVAEVHNILPSTKLSIIGEFFQRVEHQLLAPQSATIDSIKTVYSHPQALMQCREYLRKLGVTTINYSNTAAAAEDISTWNDPTKAAVASSLAGELYGLKNLASNIEDADDNSTVFLAMAKEPIDPEGEHIITTLLFTARNIPAALYKALGGFATNNVNLLKLESYIPGGTSNTAQFFVSFEGSTKQRNVQLAIEELGFFCRHVKVLGVYPAAAERYVKTPSKTTK